MDDSAANRVLSELVEAGVRELVVCPGARNAAFITALTSDSRFKVYWHFEERSAAFFALGRAASRHRPVAVITTSGTAAGELLPATMEACYSGVPLVLVTADRPRRFRGTGAPQAAEQVNLFGVYARTIDIEGDESPCWEMPRGPIHLNVALEDPRSTPKSGEAEVLSADEFFAGAKTPQVVVGKLAEHEQEPAVRFLVEYGAPAYLEAPSGLRGRPELKDIAVRVPDGLLGRFSFDGLVRIGGVPTHRLWRDLEDSQAHLPVISFSSVPFSGLARPNQLVTGELRETLPSVNRRADWAELRADDRARYERLTDLLRSEPASEPGQFLSLSRRIPAGAMVFVGNSLPVREWDLAADDQRQHSVQVSRGLNGIDGQLSTFLGMAEAGRENWAVLGDLTTLYDLAGPWIAAQMASEISATLVVVNNDGGRIFERMFSAKEFLNHHGRGFEDWARMWDMPYQRVTSAAEISARPAGLSVVELVPDAAATARFWEKYREVIT